MTMCPTIQSKCLIIYETRWIVSTRFFDLKGVDWDSGTRFTPDVRVLFDPAMTAQGIDNVIETAADWILE